MATRPRRRKRPGWPATGRRLCERPRLSLVLLAGAGLLSKSLSRLEGQPLGFDAERRLVVRIDPPALAGEPEGTAVKAATYHQLRVHAEPGGHTEITVYLDV